MKNKMPLFFIIPGIAVAAIVGAALFFRMMPSKPAPAAGNNDFPKSIDNGQAVQPKTFLGNLFGGNQPTPTPTPANANDLSTQLKGTYDDGGQTDFNALQQQAAGL